MGAEAHSSPSPGRLRCSSGTAGRCRCGASLRAQRVVMLRYSWSSHEAGACGIVFVRDENSWIVDFCISLDNMCR